MSGIPTAAIRNLAGLSIDSNNALTNVEALSGLTSVTGNVSITQCGLLTTLKGLNSLATIGTGLIVTHNENLINLLHLITWISFVVWIFCHGRTLASIID